MLRRFTPVISPSALQARALESRPKKVKSMTVWKRVPSRRSLKEAVGFSVASLTGWLFSLFEMSALTEATVLLGTVSGAACLLAFFGPVPGCGPASELAFLLWFYTRIYIASCETQRRQMCVFPAHVQPLHFTIITAQRCCFLFAKAILSSLRPWVNDHIL